MAYEDIYKGLTAEERERMIQADIPKFEAVGKVERTEEEIEASKEELLKLIEKFKKE